MFKRQRTACLRVRGSPFGDMRYAKQSNRASTVESESFAFASSEAFREWIREGAFREGSRSEPLGNTGDTHYSSVLAPSSDAQGTPYENPWRAPNETRQPLGSRRKRGNPMDHFSGSMLVCGGVGPRAGPPYPTFVNHLGWGDHNLHTLPVLRHAAAVDGLLPSSRHGDRGGPFRSVS